MPDKSGKLTATEHSVVLAHLFEQVSEALENPSATTLRETMEYISDVCDPESGLNVNVKTGEVEVVWPEAEADEEEYDEEDEGEDADGDDDEK